MTQSFDEWLESMGHMDGYQHHYQDAYDTGYEVGAQSRQSEVDELHLKYSRDSQALHNVIEMEVNKRDELQKRIDVYEKHITVIKHIHENEFNEDSDTSWILGNLDGFFECLNDDLKGKQND